MQKIDTKIFSNQQRYVKQRDCKVIHLIAPRVRADNTRRLNPVPVDLDAKFLLGLTEAIRGEIDIVAKSSETELAKLTTPCQVLPPSEWTGLSGAPELIAAFVRPNDQSVDAVPRNAAEKLRCECVTSGTIFLNGMYSQQRPVLASA